MTALIVALAVATLLLAVLVAGLLRSHAEILRALHDLGVDMEGGRATLRPGAGAAAGATSPVRLTPREGVPEPREDGATTRATDIAGTTPADEAVTIGIAGAGHRTLLAFLSSGCLTCAGFWQAFRSPASLGLPADVRPVIVTKGPEAESEVRIDELAPPGIPLVMSTEAWLDYEVPVAPYFILVDGPSASVLGEGAASQWSQVASLLGRALDDLAHATETRRRWRPSTDAEREADADRHLLAAGIVPGDPRLYPEPGSSAVQE